VLKLTEHSGVKCSYCFRMSMSRTRCKPRNRSQSKRCEP